MPLQIFGSTNWYCMPSRIGITLYGFLYVCAVFGTADRPHCFHRSVSKTPEDVCPPEASAYNQIFSAVHDDILAPFFVAVGELLHCDDLFYYVFNFGLFFGVKGRSSC